MVTRGGFAVHWHPWPPPLTFIHAADLHLGAPFRGLRALSDAWADRLLDAIPEAYDRVVDTALRHNVDFVVIAGDIFDSARASYGDYLHFFDGLKRLEEAGIPVYLCTGNHDPYTSWQHDFFALPSTPPCSRRTVPALRCTNAMANLSACWAAGATTTRRGPPTRTSRKASRAPKLCARWGSVRPRRHMAWACYIPGWIWIPSRRPPIRRRLCAQGSTIGALGHIHMRYATPENDPRLAFSGCIQGRDIKETGERGVNLVTLKKGAPNAVEFVPTARWCGSAWTWTSPTVRTFPR